MHYNKYNPRTKWVGYHLAFRHPLILQNTILPVTIKMSDNIKIHDLIEIDLLRTAIEKQSIIGNILSDYQASVFKYS